MPSASPTSISVFASSSTSLQFNWSPVPVLMRNGPIVSYTIYYQRVNGPRVHGAFSDHCAVNTNGFCSLSINAPASSITIPSLEKYVNYTVQISAWTAVGEGKLSGLVSSLTSPDIPQGTVQNVATNSPSSTSVFVSWDPPVITLQNGPIQGYRVSWTRIDSAYTNPALPKTAVILPSLLVVGIAGISNTVASSITISGM